MQKAKGEKAKGAQFLFSGLKFPDPFRAEHGV